MDEITVSNLNEEPEVVPTIELSTTPSVEPSIDPTTEPTTQPTIPIRLNEPDVPSFPLFVTVMTCSCYLSEAITAEEFGPKLKANDIVVQTESNFHDDKHPDYNPKIKVCRKPKMEENIKIRKKIGKGTSMNSCVQNHIKSTINDDMVYKIKRFHTGMIQIPGCIIETISEMNIIIQRLLDYEKQYLPNIVLTKDLYIDMINYKFEICDEYKINLQKLYEILKDEKLRQDHPEMDKKYQDHPPINLIKYTFGKDKMNIEFMLPGIMRKKDNKHITVSVTYNGKCNILGGMYDRSYTYKIYDFLLDLFRKNAKERTGLFFMPPLTDEELITGKKKTITKLSASDKRLRAITTTQLELAKDWLDQREFDEMNNWINGTTSN